MKSMRWLVIPLTMLPLAVGCGGSDTKTGNNYNLGGSSGDSTGGGGGGSTVSKGSGGSTASDAAGGSSTTTPDASVQGTGGAYVPKPDAASCTQEGDCSGSSHCDVGSKTCVECVSDANCSDHTNRIHCGPQRTCVACATNEHCANADAGPRVCNTETNACEETCSKDEECASRHTNSVYCKADAKKCVACVTDAHCNAKPDSGRQVCDTEKNTCLEACQTDDDCAISHTNSVRCKTDTKKCVMCTTNAHCEAKANTKVCNTENNTCIGCLADTDCATASPHCSNNSCRECTEDSHCVGKVGDGGVALTLCRNSGVCGEPRSTEPKDDSGSSPDKDSGQDKD